MATSGSTNFTLNRDQIISAALRRLRVLDAGETAEAGDISTGAQVLNLMLKAWQLKGINLWLTQQVCLLLEYDKQSYRLGSGASGDHCCVLSDLVKTQLAAASAASDTTLTVDSIAGIASADKIGVELNDGTLHLDVVSGAPSGVTVTLTTGVASAAAIDNYVFTFTSKIDRPIEIVEARIRDTNEGDNLVEVVKNRDDFFGISDKTTRGETTHVFYEPHIDYGTLYVWPVADDVTKRIIMTVRRTIEDFDSSTDNFDGPVEALDGIIWNLAANLAPEYGGSVSDLVIAKAQETFLDIDSRYRERKNIRFHP